MYMHVQAYEGMDQVYCTECVHLCVWGGWFCIPLFVGYGVCVQVYMYNYTFMCFNGSLASSPGQIFD